MYDKEKLSLMVTIAYSGNKLPLTIIGKIQNPVFFQGTTFPLPYMAQNNGWFN